MENFKNKLARFMYGRYGSDQLNNALLVTYIAFLILNVFVKSYFIYILITALLFWSCFRIFSRNIYQRRMENEKFLKVWNSIKAESALTIRRIKEIKTHRYRKCPNCKKVLRLPRKTGNHTVECPCCHKEFQVHIAI